MLIYKTVLKELVETRFVVNLLMKKDFMESVVCKTNPLYTKKNTTWLYVLVMSRTRFRVNPYSITAWMSRNFLLEAVTKSKSCLLPARSSLNFRPLKSVDSLWNAYMTWQEHTVKYTIHISTQNIAQSFGLFC